jgi:hypothetical protein
MTHSAFQEVLAVPLAPIAFGQVWLQSSFRMVSAQRS